jgi:hypothetical protein
MNQKQPEEEPDQITQCIGSTKSHYLQPKNTEAWYNLRKKSHPSSSHFQQEQDDEAGQRCSYGGP